MAGEKTVKQMSIWLMTAWLAGGAAWAADNLPKYYPDHFDRGGVIDRVDVGAGQIVINDMLYTLSSDTAVHTPATRFATPGDLRPGMTIGVRIARNLPGMRPVAEIWVLSDGKDAGNDN